jgi:hypothetical protein
MKNNDIYKMLACQSYNPIKILLIEKKEYKELDNLSISTLPIFNDKYRFNDINFKFVNTYYNFKK